MAAGQRPDAYSEVPAVVVLGRLNGLGVTRSLGRGNVTTYVVDCNRFSPAMWSRGAKPVLAESLQGRMLIDSLLKLRKAIGGKPVLFNTHEMAVLTLSEHSDELAAAFRFRMPEHETVLALQDKARFHELALANGLPVPRGELVQSPSEIPRKLRSLRFPVVVKPANKDAVHLGKTPGVRLFRAYEDALPGCEQMLERAGEIIVQEWVDGANDQIHFCLFYCGRNGKIVNMFTGRKLASNPPGIGLTAYCVAASEARAVLEPITEAFLERIGYAGLGSVEYKWDVTNRRFVIIEPTVGRTDWQEEIATICGVNIPLDAYRHELELPPLPRGQPSSNIVWRASILERLRTERPKFPENVVVYDGYWRRDDPLPAMIQYSFGTIAAVIHRLRK